MAKKAFVRYDGNKKIVPGTLIVQDKAPKVGTWREVPTQLCCDLITLTPYDAFGYVSSIRISPASPVTNFYIYIASSPSGYTYWEVDYFCAPIDNITDFLTHINNNYSDIGKFTAEPYPPLGPDFYQITIQVKRSFMETIFYKYEGTPFEDFLTDVTTV